MTTDYKSRLLPVTATVAVLVLLGAPLAGYARTAERQKFREEGWVPVPPQPTPPGQ
jgi:hypothetical protein